jgi:histidine ammonia-lyase
MVLAVPMKTKKTPARAPQEKAASMKTLEAHQRVEHVDDERSIGNSIIVTLKQGWSLDPRQDERVFGADTIKEALDQVRAAHSFAGPYTD